VCLDPGATGGHRLRQLGLESIHQLRVVLVPAPLEHDEHRGHELGDHELDAGRDLIE
jgi:hypothetical protein